jgi:hypothetical protein
VVVRKTDIGKKQNKKMAFTPALSPAKDLTILYKSIVEQNPNIKVKIKADEVRFKKLKKEKPRISNGHKGKKAIKLPLFR